MRPHYKNIEEALKIERPTDKVLKILSNKFAIVKMMYEDGTYTRQSYIMGIGRGTSVYSFGCLEFMKQWCRRVEEYPACSHTGWYMINPQTKREYYKTYHVKNSKMKQTYRKILELI